MPNKNKALLALTAAAMDLGVGGADAQAAGLEDTKTFQYKFTQYSEADIPSGNFANLGSRSRYEIDVQQFFYRGPIGDSAQLSFQAGIESMSGASPWYVIPDADTGAPLQVMSGATISDTRTDLQLGLRDYVTPIRQYAYSIGFSNEDDYQSLSLGYGITKLTEDRLHTLDLFVGGSLDRLSPTDASLFPSRPDDENKRSMSLSVGYSNIVHENLLISNTLSYSLYSGFLSDPYKLASVEGVALADNRPDSKNQFSWNFSARRYIPLRRAALHFDYRYYQNNWQIQSHTAQVGWYYNLNQDWQFVPNVRVYYQTGATFYRPFYTAPRADGYYSSDYRLSEFDSVSFKFKINRRFDLGGVDISLERYEAKGGHPGLVTFDRISMGFTIEFL